jgi:photosystem II stability/assembly factor-like uncharacterized protein
MRRIKYVAFLLLLFFAACKKDLLHYGKVQQLNTYSDSDRLNKILFLNDSIGFVVGGERFSNSVILATRDGGYTWQKTTYPVAGKELFDITASPQGALYTVGFDGKLLRSYDTGRSWHFSQLEYFAFMGIAFTDNTHLLTVGGVSFSSGILEYADSAGRVAKRDSFAYQFNKIVMSGSTGYLCGYGFVEKTTDGAKTWTFENVVNDNFIGIDVHGNELWMCGTNGGIYHSSDGGGNWVRYRNGNDITLPRYHLQSIVFKDSQNGWAVGEGGLLIHSDDGGRHWAEYDHFTNSTLRYVAICPNGDVMVAGDNGTLFRIVL